MANILVVEDDTTLNELLCMHLEECHHTAQSASTVAGARDALVKQGVDAVLLDYQLPDGNGLDLLREIKEDYPDLPVIVITGANDTTLPIEGTFQSAGSSTGNNTSE